MSEILDATALVNVRRARLVATEARADYHDALVGASKRGFTSEEIADALGTTPLYITNTLRLHAEGKCGCEHG